MKTKVFLLGLLLFGAVGAGGQTLYQPQCDRESLSPIKCGYYEEGYQDGANDARSNLANDYKRYKSKFGNQYRSFYRQGYDSGFASVKPFARWTDEQRNAYDQGYDDGEDDRNREISRLPARYEGRYETLYEAYYQRGYFDGYDDRRKQYDVPIAGRGNLPSPFPTRRSTRRGTVNGTLSWNGRVDNRVNIVLQGSNVRNEKIAGSLSRTTYNLQGVLPRRPALLTVRKLDGRGTVRVIQQPTRQNDYTAIVQIFDRKRGRDNYRLSINWTSPNRQEAYRSGKLTWRGRVDQTVTIEIFGDDITSLDLSGSGLSDVSFNLEGYLAARQGTVTVRKRDGRGTVTVIEQPSRQNDFTAVVQIFDPRGGDDEYEIEVTW